MNSSMPMNLFVLTFISLGAPLSAMASVSPLIGYGNSMIAQGRHACVLNGRNIQCWTGSQLGQDNQPSDLAVPTQIALGKDHACALGGNQVTCWGDTLGPLKQVPPLQNPTQISAGGEQTCALHDGGVACWGLVNRGVAWAPPLKNPVQVSASQSHACAIHDDGVTCWMDRLSGLRSNSQTLKAPPLDHPTQISVGSYYTCAIHHGGVRCWGLQTPEFDVPGLQNPIQISSGSSYGCALHDGGVKCWGRNSEGQTDVPPLRNPRYVSASESRTCAIHDGGVACWGNNGYASLNIPSSLVGSQAVPVQILIEALPEFLKQLSRDLPKSPSTMIRSVQKSLERIEGADPLAALERVWPRLLILNAIDSLILPLSNDIFENHLKPVFSESLKTANQAYKVASLRDIPKDQTTVLMALEWMKASAQELMLQVTNESDRQAVQGILALTGRAIAARPISPQDASVRALLDECDLRQTLLDRMRESHRTQGIALSLDTMIEFLTSEQIGK